MQGLFSSVWGLASLAGPLLGAFLTVTFGWRSIFTINLPLGALAFALVATQMVESRSPRPDPLDLGGALLLAGGLTALLLSVVQKAGASALPLGARALLAAGGAGALAWFVRAQARRPHPLVPPDLFRDARTVAPYAGAVLMGTAVFGVDAFVPLFVQGARGGTALSAGAVVTPVMLFWALSATVAARAVVRFGFRRIAMVGAALVLAGFAALLACLLLHAAVGPIVAACAVIGSGLGPSSMAQVLAIQHAAEERNRGVATSLVPFFRAVGGALGVAGLGALLATGLSRRLGRAADAAGELLAHGQAGAAAGLEPSAFRVVLEGALLPVFLLLALLAVMNLAVASAFPGDVDGGPSR